MFNDDDEFFYLNFNSILKTQNGNIFLIIEKRYFCILEEVKNKKSEKNLYKIIYLKSMESLIENEFLKKMELITKDLLGLFGFNSVIILSAFYPFAILKTIKYTVIWGYIKIFFLLYNPNIFIILNNGIFLMQIYNKNTFELISSRKG